MTGLHFCADFVEGVVHGFAGLFDISANDIALGDRLGGVVGFNVRASFCLMKCLSSRSDSMVFRGAIPSLLSAFLPLAISDQPTIPMMTAMRNEEMAVATWGLRPAAASWYPNKSRIPSNRMIKAV